MDDIAVVAMMTPIGESSMDSAVGMGPSIAVTSVDETPSNATARRSARASDRRRPTSASARRSCVFRSSCVTGVSSFSTTRVRPQSMRSRAVSDPTPQSPCTIAECRCRASDPS